MLFKPKTEFQNEFEDMLQVNEQLFEDVSLKRKTPDKANIASAKLILDFINKMRYPNELKLIFKSVKENDDQQMLNRE